MSSNPTKTKKKTPPRRSRRQVASRPRRVRRARLPRVTNFASRNNRVSSVGISRFTRAPGGSDYVACLKDPFFAPAPKLGIGTFIPTSKHVIWRETPSAVISNTTSSFALVFNGTPNGAYFYENANAINTLAASSVAIYPAVNATSVSTLIQTGRLINSAIRVKVRAAATGLPGTLGGIFIANEGRTNIEAMSYTTLASLGGFRSFNSSSASQIGGETQYRPADFKDFEFITSFASNNQPSGTAALPQMIIVGTGWPAAGTGNPAFQVEFTFISHIEGLSGTDSAGESDSEPDMRNGGATIDTVANFVLQSGEPLKTSLEALMALDNAHSNIQRARYSHSMSGMLGNFANGMASSPVLPHFPEAGTGPNEEKEQDHPMLVSHPTTPYPVSASAPPIGAPVSMFRTVKQF